MVQWLCISLAADQPTATLSVPRVGCHLGWLSNVGRPLRAAEVHQTHKFLTVHRGATLGSHILHSVPYHEVRLCTMDRTWESHPWWTFPKDSTHSEYRFAVRLIHWAKHFTQGSAHREDQRVRFLQWATWQIYILHSISHRWPYPETDYTQWLSVLSLATKCSQIPHRG
jgi:hypothetical protein